MSAEIAGSLRTFATLCLAVLCGAAHYHATSQQIPRPLTSIEVTAPADVARVNALNDALSNLSDKVSACVKAGQDSRTCQCRYPQELLKLRRTYASLIEQHPDWNDKLLSYPRVNKEGRTISGTLALQNLRRQLEILKCE